MTWTMGRGFVLTLRWGEMINLSISGRAILTLGLVGGGGEAYRRRDSGVKCCLARGTCTKMASCFVVQVGRISLGFNGWGREGPP